MRGKAKQEHTGPESDQADEPQPSPVSQKGPDVVQLPNTSDEFDLDARPSHDLAEILWICNITPQTPKPVRTQMVKAVARRAFFLALTEAYTEALRIADVWNEGNDPPVSDSIIERRIMRTMRVLGDVLNLFK